MIRWQNFLLKWLLLANFNCSVLLFRIQPEQAMPVIHDGLAGRGQMLLWRPNGTI